MTETWKSFALIHTKLNFKSSREKFCIVDIIANCIKKCQQRQIKGTPKKKCHVSIYEVKVQKVLQRKFTRGSILLPYYVSWGGSSSFYAQSEPCYFSSTLNLMYLQLSACMKTYLSRYFEVKGSCLSLVKVYY